MSVPSGASIVFQHRCKICQMAQTNPELFKELHQLVLESNISYTRSMAIINNRIDSQNLGCAKLNSNNMTVHFGSHITLPDRMTAEAGRLLTGGNPSLKQVNPEVGQFVEDMVRRKLGSEVSDYLNLERVRGMLTDKLELLDGLTDKTNADGSLVIDYDALSKYIDIVREIRKCITDVNKIRQSKQLVSLVIKSLVEKNTMEIVRQMAREHDQVMKDLVLAGVDQSIVNDAKLKLGMRLAEVVATTARNAVSDVIRSYKLE